MKRVELDRVLVERVEVWSWGDKMGNLSASFFWQEVKVKVLLWGQS